MKVRILLEQEARRDDPEHGYLASGEVVDVPKERALAMLGRGEAEAVADKPTRKAVAPDTETR